MSSGEKLVKLRKPLRIFWLGAHKVLAKTELVRLRELGFEVFNPPYLSHVFDQSVQGRWDEYQPTSLPIEIFQRLSRYNFFYNQIDEEIADILNDYFDAFIVTIVPRWAVEVMRVFSGPVIYRAYGQTSLISEDIEAVGGREIIEAHGRFYFSPHAAEPLEHEAEWLRQKARIIPYCLGPEIFEVKDNWSNDSDPKSGDIIIGAPNIAGNPFHLCHYHFLREFFYEPYYKLGGVQLRPVDNSQVYHSLPRDQHIRKMITASGYFYSYRDPRVCYLPPIEMTVLGAPVAYFSGSLLAKMVGDRGPGEARTISEAHKICSALRNSDRGIIEEVRSAQSVVRDRYDPRYVWPIFDREMLSMLSIEPRADPDLSVCASLSQSGQLKSFLRLYLEGVMPSNEAARYDLLDEAIRAMDPSQSLRGGQKLVLKHRLQSSAEGLSAAIKATGKTNEALWSSLVRDADAVVVRSVGGSRNVMIQSDGVIGRLTYDKHTRTLSRVAEKGEAGWLTFGPYIAFDKGRYVASYQFETDAFSIALGEVDVMASGQQKVAAPLIANEEGFQRIDLSFNVENSDEIYEFRVQSNGLAAVKLVSVSVIGIGN